MSIKVVTAQYLRKNFKKIADNISDYNDVVLVARPKNKNVVLISEKEYKSWQETNYLLSTKANRLALQEGMSTDHSEEKFDSWRMGKISSK